MRKSLVVLGIGVLGAAIYYAPQVQAQGNAAAYTAAQATAGKAAYAQQCASCHGENLDDGEFAPPLKGAAFLQKYGGKAASEVFAVMSGKMPPSSPGSLGGQTYAQVLAYILQSNNIAAGNTELPSDATVLAALIVGQAPAAQGGGPGGGLSPYADKPPAVNRPNPLDKFTAVSDAMLANPPASEWLTWRRTYDDQGFSPLKQIDKSNVGNLRVAWTWSLPSGANEGTPLEHDGVIFANGFGDQIQALDAATGDLLWQYTRQLPKDARPTPKRNMAIYGNKIYMGTSDVHLVALDVKTGKVIWDREVQDYHDGTGLTGGPLAAKGKVMIGTVRGRSTSPQIVAFDAETGKVAWKFHTIPLPGEFGGDSWNGVPYEKRTGASVWTAGSYDPTLGLAFFGVGQTYDTGPLVHPINQPGVTSDALYTDSTLAIDPDTGKLVWHFQHQPNDQWDLDWAFERTLIKLPVNGQNKTAVITSGKQAIYEALEADTGKYLFSIDLGLQNTVTAIDPKTGAKTINRNLVPGDGEVKTVCPHAGGAKSWMPGSYNPNTKTVFVPLVEACMDMIPVGPGGRGSLTSGVRWTLRPRPGTDGKFGRLEAVSLETRKPVWIERHRAPESTGVLSTAGGLVFSGSIDRFIRAYDDATGKTLWEMRLNDVPSDAPIAYSVNGKEYIAVGVGNGGAQAMTFPPLVPELQNPTDRGAEIWVFELPDRAGSARSTRTR